MKTKLALLALLVLIGTMVTGCLLFDGTAEAPVLATNPPLWIQDTWDTDWCDAVFVFTDDTIEYTVGITVNSITYEVAHMSDAYETIAVATYEVGGLEDDILTAYRFVKTSPTTVDFYIIRGSTVFGPNELVRRVPPAPMPNIAPVAIITFAIGSDATQTGSYKTAIGYTNVFGSESYDIDGIIVGCRWDFGDGTGRTGNWADFQEIGHIYHVRGNYDVVLTVYDDDGAEATVTRRVKVCDI